MRHAFVPMLLIALAACTQAPATHGDRADAAPARTAPAPAIAKAPAEATTSNASPPGAAEDPTTRRGVARMDGYGALRFGMTAAQAQAAWSDDLRGDAPGADNCVYLTPAWSEGRDNFALMFERGRFVRYDVAKPQEIAPGGGRVGMSRGGIEALYPGRVEVRLHDYDAAGRYLRIADPAMRGRAMLFEIDASGQVTRWRVGLEPQVDYTEGCS